LRILTLIENTAAIDKLFVENGISFYIEAGGAKILFDTGASGRFKVNAEKMKVTLSQLDCAVISHNHTGHVGGLDTLLETCPNIKIFMRKSAQTTTFKQSGLFKIPIGHPREFYEKIADNIVAFNCFQEVAPGVFLMSDETLYHARNDIPLLIKRQGDGEENFTLKIEKDTFADEVFMVIFPSLDEKDGCVVVSPCSHRGIVNVLKSVQNTWKSAPILSVVGGFHLMGKNSRKFYCPPSDIADLADELADLHVGMLYTCHCTGEKGYELLKEKLGNQIQYLQAGEELEF